MQHFPSRKALLPPPKTERTCLARLQAIKKSLGARMPFLDECLCRIVGALSGNARHGGKEGVAEITDLSYPTIAKGAGESASVPGDPKARRDVEDEVRVRAEDAGKQVKTESD